ncbi:MAG: fibrobacter succinogenes major paralogous domain-containing protein, partial [Rikenellaceae bacterium]|nr:fibrobacter succinogenes major paralogous domain-containing protein [Rikenellaceae bacterium]
SSDYGYIKFTSGSNSVEFPAVGYRDASGSLYDSGGEGVYWSSVAGSSSGAYGLSFYSGSLTMYTNDKQYGFSVRCVR